VNRDFSIVSVTRGKQRRARAIVCLIDFRICNEESLGLPLALLFGFLDGLAELFDGVDLRRIQ
jgi:hypothetical protein